MKLYTVKINNAGAIRQLLRGGEFCFSFSAAYQHANRYQKENPDSDYFIESVHPRDFSVYRHQITRKYPF